MPALEVQIAILEGVTSLATASNTVDEAIVKLRKLVGLPGPLVGGGNFTRCFEAPRRGGGVHGLTRQEVRLRKELGGARWRGDVVLEAQAEVKLQLVTILLDNALWREGLRYEPRHDGLDDHLLTRRLASSFVDFDGSFEPRTAADVLRYGGLVLTGQIMGRGRCT